MWLHEAKALCPEIIVVDYDFEAYEQTAMKMYDILTSHFDRIEVLSCDECIVDISSLNEPIDQQIQSIRIEIKEAIKCPVSIGIGINPLTARLAMKKAKPDGYYCLLTNIEEYISSLSINDLPGFGRQMTYQLEQIGIHTCHDVNGVPDHVLEETIGKKHSLRLKNMIKGIDMSLFEKETERKTIGMTINWGIRFSTEEEIKEFIFRMSEEISRRMETIKMLGTSMTMKVMVRKEGVGEAVKYKGHGIVDKHSKTIDISETKEPSKLHKYALSIWNQLHIIPQELRGIGIHIGKLHSIQPVQIKESTIYKQLMKANEMQMKKQTNNQQKQTINAFPRYSQIDKTVFNQLPPDIKKELSDYYTKGKKKVYKPLTLMNEQDQINFKHEELMIPDEEEPPIEKDLFEIEDTLKMCELFIQFIKTRNVVTLFHIEVILQYLKVLCKHHYYKDFQKIVNAVNELLNESKYNQFKEILNNYANQMYTESFNEYILSFN